MKILALLSLLVFQGTSAFADSYQVSVSDTELGNVILAKDCLDYTVCGGSGSSIAGGNPDYRLHAFIDLSEVEMNSVLKVCNFAKLGIKVSVKNLSKNAVVPVSTVDNGYDIRVKFPSVYVAELSPTNKIEKYNKVKAMLDAKQRQAAIDVVLAEYGLSTGGYAVKFGGDMGKAGAVTDHQSKTVTVSDSIFEHPCILIQTMRHELEHVSQIAKVNACASKGKGHNLVDHVARERSAYLNDIRNVSLFCADPDMTKSIEEFMTSVFFQSYTR